MPTVAVDGQLILSGTITSTAMLLLIAAAGKLAARARRADADSAIRRALRIPPARWRVVELVTGIAEVATAIGVCSGRCPTISGTALASMGAAFGVTLAYTRHAGTPGGCECVRLRGASRTITWRTLARAAWLLGVGTLTVFLRPPGLRAITHPWYDGGLVVAGIILAGLSADLPPRTRRCRRRLWLPTRDTYKALTRTTVFDAITTMVGPLGPPYRHRRAGCVDEFWTPATARPATAHDAHRPDTVVFRVTHTGAAGAVAVQAAVLRHDQHTQPPHAHRNRALWNRVAGPTVEHDGRDPKPGSIKR